MPAKFRQALTDHFLHGYAIKEIAQRRKFPFGTVLSRISNGKRLLRAAWNPAGQEGGR